MSLKTNKIKLQHNYFTFGKTRFKLFFVGISSYHRLRANIIIRILCCVQESFGNRCNRNSYLAYSEIFLWRSGQVQYLTSLTLSAALYCKHVSRMSHIRLFTVTHHCRSGTQNLVLKSIFFLTLFEPHLSFFGKHIICINLLENLYRWCVFIFTLL